MNKNKLIFAFFSSLFILIVQLIYAKVFGPKNILVGIIMALGAITFTKKSLTVRPVYKAFTFLILNLSLGVCAYLASLNIYIGLIINIITMFSVTYLYMNDFTPPSSYIFLLGYIFMWASPVSINELPQRLGALIFGVILIVILQFIFNRKSFENKSKLMLAKAIKHTIKELDDLNNNKYETKESILINQEIRSIMSLINSYTFKRFYSTIEGKLILSIAISVERLNILTNEMSKQNYDKDFVVQLKNQLINILNLLDDKSDISILISNINTFLNNNKNEEDIYKLEIIEVIEILKYNIVHLNTLDYKELKTINNDVKISKEFTKYSKFKRNLNLNSIIFTYSIKQALLISIAMFLSDYLGWAYGKWVVSSIYVVMQPYIEDCKIKSKQRLLGTIFGVLLFYVLFSFIQDMVPNSLILFVAFIFYFYNTDYMIKVISLTVVSLSVIGFSQNINILTLTRFLNVVIGVVIALVINSYVFPYNIDKALDDLKNKYDRVIKFIKVEISKCKDDVFHEEKFIKSILLCNDIENKLILNNKRVQDKSLEEFLFVRNAVLSDVRFLILYNSYLKKCDFDSVVDSKHITNDLINKIIK